MSIVTGMFIHAPTFAQTNNFFGTSGALNQAVWSRDSLGPFNENFVTSGGGIANFLNNANINGGSISVAGINARANINLTSPTGTISNAIPIVPIFVDSGFTLDMGSQNWSSAANAGYTKNGLGTLALSGGNYGGGFTLNAGTVILRGVNALGNHTNNRLTLNGGTIAANASRDLSNRYPQGIFINNNVVFGATTGLASTTANLTFNNTMHLSNSMHTITHGNNGNVTFLGVISGLGGLRYTRQNNNLTGRFVLGSENTYAGATIIENCSVQSGATNPFGSNPQHLNYNQLVANNATIIADSGFTLNHLNAGLFIESNGLTINTTSHSIVVDCPVYGNGNINKLGAGTLNIGNMQNFAGLLNVQQGSITGNTNAFSSNNLVQLSAGTTFILNGLSYMVKSITGTGIVTNLTTDSVRLNIILNDTTVLFGGEIQNGQGVVNLIKNGNGTYILSNAQTYSGITLVKNGILALENTLASAHIIVEPNAVLRIQGNLTLQQLTLHEGAKLEVLNGFTLTIGQFFNCNVSAELQLDGNITYAPAAGLNYFGNGLLNAGKEWQATLPRTVIIQPFAEVVNNANKTIPRVFVIAGTLNASTFSFSGRADSLNIIGTIKTANPNGIINVGSTATTFTGYDNGNLFNQTLNPNCTIIFDAVGNQLVNGAVNYRHLVVRNGGVKTPIGTLNIDSSLVIDKNTTLNGNNARIGLPATHLTMHDSAVLIMGSTQTQPHMNGAYVLSNTSTMVFTNNSATAQTLRTGKVFSNIVVNGANVVFPASGISLLPGCSLRVTEVGTMVVSSQNGLFGLSNAAVLTTNAALIQLDSGSTVVFNRSANPSQTISVLNQPYFNLTIAGSGIKNIAVNTTVNGRLTLTSSTLNLGSHQLTLNRNPLVVNGTLNARLATLNLLEGVDSLPNNLLLDGEVGTLNIHTNNNFILGLNLTVHNNLTVHAANLHTNGFNLVLNAANATATFNPNARLTINGGTVNFNNRPVIFKSSVEGTATLGQVTGHLQGSGNITLERYLPARRAFRFLASAVTTGNGIANNWQQQTHITGNGGTANGFDPTQTNNPSMFTLNTALQQWQAISNTQTQELLQGVGYRLLVRGDRSIDLNNNNATSTPVILSATGTHLAGDKVYNTQSAPAIANGVNQYTLMGNPFHSTIDWLTVTKQDISPVLHMWRANGGSNNRGLYVSFNALTGISSDNIANQYIGAGYAFMVKTTGPNPQLTIKESDKVVRMQPSVILGKLNPFTGIRLSIYEDNTNYADGLVLYEHVEAKAEADDYDSDKWLNPGISIFTKSSNHMNMAVNATPNLGLQHEFPVYINNPENREYTFIADEVRHTQLKFWLKDGYLGTYTALFNDVKYNFFIHQNDSKTFANRFSIVTGLSTTEVNEIKNNFNVSAYPNPFNNSLNLHFGNMENRVDVKVYSSAGQLVYAEDYLNLKQTMLNTQTWLPGVYLINFTSNNGLNKTIKVVK
jgi:autotransporter-associated beta strand protein